MAALGLRGLALGLTTLAATALVVASPYSDFVIDNTGPALYWNLDETGGATASDLVAANDGTYHNCTLAQAGPRPADGFAHMDSANLAPSSGRNGGTAYASLFTSAGVDVDQYSMQTWLNSSVPFTTYNLNYFLSRGAGTTASSEVRDSVGVWGNYSSSVWANQVFMFPGPAGGGSSVAGPTKLSPNTWYHALLVRDGDNVKVYLNGQLEIERTWAWGGGVTTDKGECFNAGTRVDSVTTSTALGLTGRVDEVVVWDRALTADEARGLYLAAFPEYPQAVLRDAPAAYWRLNETVGDNSATDVSGNGKTQTLGDGSTGATRSGAPPDIGPRPGALIGDTGGKQIALAFEPGNNAPTLPTGHSGTGVNDYVLRVGSGSDPKVIVPDDEYTVELWAHPSAISGGVLGYLFQRRDFDGSSGVGDALGMSLGHSTAPEGVLFFYDGANVLKNTSDPTVLDVDAWYHLALTRDGGEVTAYLNGQVEFTGTVPVPAAGKFNQGTWVFGGRSDHDSLKWEGNLDEIAIYGRALSASEILAHYNAAIPEPTTVALLALGGLGLVARRRRRGR